MIALERDWFVNYRVVSLFMFTNETKSSCYRFALSLHTVLPMLTLLPCCHQPAYQTHLSWTSKWHGSLLHSYITSSSLQSHKNTTDFSKLSVLLTRWILTNSSHSHPHHHHPYRAKHSCSLHQAFYSAKSTLDIPDGQPRNSNPLGKVIG
jgi:hypothetical protein